MARPKKQPNLRPIQAAQRYLALHSPELRETPLRMRCLDGPPEAPRYMVTGDICCAHTCPYGVRPEEAACGSCPIGNCSLRHAVCLLLNRDYQVLKESHSGVKWSSSAPPIDEL